MSTVTQLPTMCNPEKLGQAELKVEVLRMQSEVVLMGDRLHQMAVAAFNLNELVGRLVDAHQAGDSVYIASQLQVLADHRSRMMKAPAKAH